MRNAEMLPLKDLNTKGFDEVRKSYHCSKKSRLRTAPNKNEICFPYDIVGIIIRILKVLSHFYPSRTITCRGTCLPNYTMHDTFSVWCPYNETPPNASFHPRIQIHVLFFSAKGDTQKYGKTQKTKQNRERKDDISHARPRQLSPKKTRHERVESKRKGNEKESAQNSEFIKISSLHGDRSCGHSNLWILSMHDHGVQFDTVTTTEQLQL